MIRVLLLGNSIISVSRIKWLAFQMEMQCVFYEQKLISYKFWSILCYVPFDDGYLSVYHLPPMDLCLRLPRLR